MMNLITFSLVSVLVFFFSGALSQDWTNVSLEDFRAKILELEKVKKPNESFSVVGEYHFYEQHQGGEPAYSFPLIMRIQPQKKKVYMEQLGRLMVQNEKMLITCDTATRQLIVQEPNTSFYKQRMTEDFNPLINSNSKAKYRKSGRMEIYRLEFPEGGTYKAMELWVNPTKNVIEKYVMFAERQVKDEFKEEVEYIQPRMEIIYSNYTFGEAVNKQEFPDPQDYFSDLNQLIPTVKYKEFEIIDLRNQD